MAKNIYLPAGLIAGTLLSFMLAGCLTTESGYSRGRVGYQTGPSPMYQDDYDYYPGYETYYSRNRHEYVYRDGNTWVRRAQPLGIAANVLLSAPSVRVDFHDAPEQHHASVVKSYPKNWKPAGKAQANKNDQRNDNKNNDRKDRNDDNQRN